MLPEELVTLLHQEIDEQVARFTGDGGDVNSVVKIKVEADGELFHRALTLT